MAQAGREVSADGAARLFAEAIVTAASQVPALHPGAARRGQSSRPEHVRNRWWDDDCRAAKRVCRDAERWFGHGSWEHRATQRALRRMTDARKRAFEAQAGDRLRDAFYEDSVGFWKAYKGRKATGPLDGDVNGLTGHFRGVMESAGRI